MIKVRKKLAITSKIIKAILDNNAQNLTRLRTHEYTLSCTYDM